jgi:hypothetical protein
MEVDYEHEGENNEIILKMLQSVYNLKQLSKITKVKEHYHCLYIYVEDYRLYGWMKSKQKLQKLLGNSTVGEKVVFFNPEYEWKPPVRLSEIELTELGTEKDIELEERKFKQHENLQDMDAYGDALYDQDRRRKGK